MIRNLASGILLLSALLASNWLHALGLGEVRLLSALNQPLDAEVPIYDDQTLEQWEIKASLASKEDYARAGIPRGYFIQSLKIELQGSGSGRVIRIRSNDLVREPFLNFLIRVEWPNGRVLKEVTLLLDPPVFSNEPGTRIQAAKAEDAGLTEALGSKEPDYDKRGVKSDSDLEAELLGYTPPKESEASDELTKGGRVDSGRKVADASHGDVPATRSSTSSTSKGSSTRHSDSVTGSSDQPSTRDRQDERFTYEVQKNDTLWEIARTVHPERDYTPQQVMLAIQDINPDAFIQGNINRLKRNRTLRIPTADEIASRNRRVALAEVRRQNQLFDEFRGTRVAQIDATDKDASGTSTGTVERDELRLLSATSSDNKSGRATGDSKGTSGGEAARQLKLAQEELDRSRRENVELKGRLQDLQEQVQTLQRLIALKDEQLANLQAQTTQTPDDSVDRDEFEEESVVEEEDDSVDTAQVDSSTVDETPPDTDKQDSQRVSANNEEASQSLLDSVLGGDLMLPVGGAIAVIIALLAVMMIKKRREAAEDDEEYYESDMSDVGMGADLAYAGAPAATGLEFEEDSAPGVDELLKDAEDAMTYGRHEKAQQLLKEALQVDGSRVDVHLKLMEVYAELKDEMSFNNQKAAVQALGDASDVARADALAANFKSVEPEEIGDLDLGDLEAGISDFGESKPAAPEPEAPMEEDLSGEISLDDLEAEMQTDEQMPAEDNNLEFDVGDIDLDAPEMAEEEEEPEEETTLEFDLTSLTSAQPDAGQDEPELPPSMELPELDEDASADSGMSMDFDGFDAELPADVPDLSADTDTLESADDSDSMSMDFDMGGLSTDADAPAESAEPEMSADAGLDFDMGGLEDAPAVSAPALTAGADLDASDDMSLDSLDSDMGDVDFGLGLDADAPPAPEPIAAPEVAAPAEPEPAPAPPPPAPAKEKALSVDLDSINLDGGDEDMSFLGGTDEAETKLDLARAYIDMDDIEGAKDILQEVMDEGNDQQKADAQKLLDSIA